MKEKISRSLRALIRIIHFEKRAEKNMPVREHNIWGTAGRSEIMIARNLVRMKFPRD